MDTFTVIYRCGGHLNTTWRKCLPVETLAQAQVMRHRVERMGYKAVIHRTRILDAIGMPQGWEA